MNTSCRLNNGEDGVCVEILSCPMHKKLLSDRSKLVTCGYVGKTPIICCPKLGDVVHQSISQKSKFIIHFLVDFTFYFA